MIRFTAKLATAGTGLWSTAKRLVPSKAIGINYINDEEDFGELIVKFDTAKWDIYELGLIYTDPVWLDQLKDELATAGFDPVDVTYSEQGMQGNDYVSLDVGKHFLASWFDIVGNKVVDFYGS
jgi:hypothetical protein